MSISSRKQAKPRWQTSSISPSPWAGEWVTRMSTRGDLPASYLTFLVTMANRPLFYVHGNHDVRYENQPPEGCDAWGLSGSSMKYFPEAFTMVVSPYSLIRGKSGAYCKNQPPEGCDCIDGHVVEFKGYRILGLGGSMKYNESPHQYSERQMKRRISKLERSLKKGGVDILRLAMVTRKVR